MYTGFYQTTKAIHFVCLSGVLLKQNSKKAAKHAFIVSDLIVKVSGYDKERDPRGMLMFYS